MAIESTPLTLSERGSLIAGADTSETTLFTETKSVARHPDCSSQKLAASALQPNIPVCGDMPVAELADHIEARHHEYLRVELPRLSAMIDNVTAEYASRNPELLTLDAVFEMFRLDMEVHMAREEQTLFPMIKALDTPTPTLAALHASLAQPIRRLVADHCEANDALKEIRILTNDYTPPPGAGDNYRSMLLALACLEVDMYVHIHKESSILFPRAIELEVAAKTEAGYLAKSDAEWEQD